MMAMQRQMQDDMESMRTTIADQMNGVVREVEKMQLSIQAQGEQTRKERRKWEEDMEASIRTAFSQQGHSLDTAIANATKGVAAAAAAAAEAHAALKAMDGKFAAMDTRLGSMHEKDAKLESKLAELAKQVESIAQQQKEAPAMPMHGHDKELHFKLAIPAQQLDSRCDHRGCVASLLFSTINVGVGVVAASKMAETPPPAGAAGDKAARMYIHFIVGTHAEADAIRMQRKHFRGTAYTCFDYLTSEEQRQFAALKPKFDEAKRAGKSGTYFRRAQLFVEGKEVAVDDGLMKE
jgi:hypothetical protein